MGINRPTVRNGAEALGTNEEGDRDGLDFVSLPSPKVGKDERLSPLSQAEIEVDLSKAYNGQKENKLRGKSADASGSEYKLYEDQIDGNRQKKSKKAAKGPSVSILAALRFATFTDKLTLVVGMISALICGALLPVFAILIGDAVESFESDVDVDLDELSEAALAIAILAVALGVTEFTYYVIFSRASERIVKRIRVESLAAMMKQEIAWYDTANAADLASRVTGDTVSIQEGIGEKFGQLFRFLSQFITGFIVAFSVGWKLALAMMACVPFLAICFGIVISASRRAALSAQEAYAEGARVAEETLGSIRTVQAFNAQEKSQSLYEKGVVNAMQSQFKSQRRLAFGVGTTIGIVMLTYAFGLWFGSKLLADGDSVIDSVGKVVTVFQAVLIGSMALGNASPNLVAVGQARSSLQKCLEVIDRPSAMQEGEDGGGEQPQKCFGKIEMKNITFSYPSRPSQKVLEDFNLTIESGETVALVGMSGGGKSTIISLIERFYDPQEGEVLLDGQNVKSLNIHWLRANMALVAQEPPLFSQSIRENILSGKTYLQSGTTHSNANAGPTDEQQRTESLETKSAAEQEAVEEEVRRAAVMANAHGFIQSFTMGYDTQVGEQGIQLSGGQKQRIAIARAVIRDPSVLLLDEATSALDTESEKVVQEALDRLLESKRRTTVVIAHRLSTIRKADRIVVIEGGRVVEQGSHEALLQIKDGMYRKYLELQKTKETTAEDHADLWLDDKVGSDPGKQNQKQAQNAGSEEMVALAAEQGSEAARGVPPDSLSLEGSVVEEGQPPVSPAMGSAALAVAHTFSVQEVPRKSPTAGGEYQKVLSKLGKQQKEDQDQQQQQQEASNEDTLLGEFTLKPVNRRLLAMNLEWKNWLAVAIITAAISGVTFPLFGLIMTEYISAMVSKQGDELVDATRIYTIIVLILAVVLGVIRMVQVSAFGILSENLVKKLRLMTFAAMLRQDIGWFDKEEHSTGALTEQLSSTASLIRAISGENISRIVMASFTFVIGLVLAFVLGSWILTCVMLVLFPFLVASHVAHGMAMRATSMEIRKNMENAGKTVTESLSNIRTVKSLGAEQQRVSEYDAYLQKPLQSGIKEAKRNGLFLGLGDMLIYLTYAGIFYLGAVLVDNDTITFDELFRSLMIVIFAAQGVGLSVGMLGDKTKAEAAVSQMFTVADRVPVIDASEDFGVVPQGNVEGEISIRDLTFSYPVRKDVPVLKSFSLNIPAGKTMAIVGASGGGKSTIVTLLERFYDYEEGEILFDGRDLRSLNVRWLRRVLGYVGQEPVLFNGTIADNIMYAKQGATEEEVREAAIKANADGFIRSFPDGYDTNVGQKGLQLSGGQKQRIAIARVILKDPAVLLLDEATSALDSESERVVQETLDQLLTHRRRTTIVIAHRLSTIKDADSIAVVESGRVVETGTHEELTQKRGAYAKLVEYQQGQH